MKAIKSKEKNNSSKTQGHWPTFQFIYFVFFHLWLRFSELNLVQIHDDVMVNITEKRKSKNHNTDVLMIEKINKK